MKDEGTWDHEVRRLAHSVEDNLSVHPDLESLVAHRRGELPAAQADQVEEHLAWCRDCAFLWHDLPLFFEDEVEEPLDADERAADWQALQDRLERVPLAPKEMPAPQGRPGSRPLLAAGLAAALAVAVGGAALWIGHLTDRLEEARGPRGNVPIHDLVPAAAERAGEEVPPSIDLDGSPLLILNFKSDLDYPPYEVRIVSKGGGPVWTLGGLEPTVFGNLTLELPRGSLEPGLYHLVVYSDGAASPVATFSIRITAPSYEAGPRPS